MQGEDRGGIRERSKGGRTAKGGEEGRKSRTRATFTTIDKYDYVRTVCENDASGRPVGYERSHRAREES